MYNDHQISILIIEDNPGDQLLLHENLKNTNLFIENIVMVETLAEAGKCLNDQTFSLIFLDLFLPDSAGLESFRELLKINQSLPVIIYSGLSDTKTALNAITLGAQDFLIKGDYTTTLLEKTVRYSIERKINLDALEKSNQRYNLISKATHDMVWDSNLLTGEVYRNPEGWKKIFRSNNAKEMGVHDDFNSKVHPADYLQLIKAFDDIIHSHDQEVFAIEFRICRDDGTIGWLEDRGYIIRNNEGKVVRLMGAAHDITDRKNAERKVLLSEQRFKSLVQNGSDLISILDQKGYYLYSSPTVKKIMGYEPEFIVGKNVFSFIHPDDISTIKTYMANNQNKDYPNLLPFRYKNAHGVWRWLESKVTDMSDNPEIQGFVFNSRDITERKIADDEIAKLSLVAKTTLSGVFILDKERKFQWVNDAFTNITGFTIEEAIGKTPPELLYGKDPDPELFTYMRSQMAKGLPFEGERLNYTKSGRPIWIWLQLQSIRNDKGEIKQYFAVQTDITEKKKTEDELKKLSMVAKETINGIIISDTEQNIVWVNDAFTKMFGYELAEVIGKKPREFLTGPETDRNVIKDVQNKKRNITEPFAFEILCYSKSGNKRYMSVLIQPIFDEQGKVKQTFALQTDITEKKKLEEQVEMEKLIKQKQITEAVFAAQESERSEIGRELHDNVNQLLGATRLYIDMAKANAEDRDSLLTSASTYTLTAIEEIRKLSKTLITPLIKEIGLADSITDLTEEIMHVHPIQIAFTSTKFNEDGLSDKFKLNIFRIIQEQINNILKHARAEKININIEDNFGNLQVSVNDNGIGFDTSKRKNGVGITNIKSRSELFNGSVQLASSPGKGTTLSITFNKTDISLSLN